MYGYGQGVPQNYVLAYMWVNLAALRFSATAERLNEHTAVQGRSSLAAKMTPAELAEARRLAREWKPIESADSLDP
jgi:uncharacterized protein